MNIDLNLTDEEAVYLRDALRTVLANQPSALVVTAIEQIDLAFARAAVEVVEEAAVDAALAAYVEIVRTNNTVQDVLDVLADGESVEIAYEVCEHAHHVGIRPNAAGGSWQTSGWFDAVQDAVEDRLAEMLRAT